VRIVAAGALAAAIAVPIVRRKRRIPASATLAALVSGPVALAVLRPRSRIRDSALFALQMWGFVMAHELPYDDPEALRRRLRVHYPIVADRIIGAGKLPNARLQKLLSRPGRVTRLDRVLSAAHWAWFMEPHAALVWILTSDPDRFPRAARQLAATYDIGCAVYFALPTAPPWWASEQGYVDEDVRRIMVDTGEQVWRDAWQPLYDRFNGNPWAAMPSLHFATAMMAAIQLSEAGPIAGTAGWAYTATLGFALVYLGEHYVTDLIAGALLVALVRSGEPVVEPLVEAINRRLRALEEIAEGR
jgi:membrane-associated phospholipid phosphatase